MTPWLSVHFLLVVVLLCGAAPTSEDCERLVRPTSMTDRSMMSGKMYLVAGYTDSAVLKYILKVIDSYWIQLSASVSRADEVVMHQEYKINGTCLASTVRGIISGDTAVTEFVANTTSTFQLLPSCDACFHLSINTTFEKNNEPHSTQRMESSAQTDEVMGRALYLMVSDPNVTDSVLEQFKKTASCMGFSEELDYQHKAENSFCAEGEGLRLLPSNSSMSVTS